MPPSLISQDPATRPVLRPRSYLESSDGSALVVVPLKQNPDFQRPTASSKEDTIKAHDFKQLTMPSVLGVPLPSSSTVTVTQATSPELLLGLVNALLWALTSLLLYVQILEKRRIGAHIAQQLANKRRVHEELTRKVPGGNTLRERRLEQIPEKDEVEERDDVGFKVVPQSRPGWRIGLFLEEDLKKAIGEEIPEAEEDGGFEMREDELTDLLDGDFREAMVDEYRALRKGSDVEQHREGLAEEGESDDGLEVRMPARRLLDREGNPIERR